jgi:hypothetical protein
MGKASGKKVESAKRLRYIRALERFSKSIISYLFKSDEVSKEVYDKKVDNNRKFLDRAESVVLYKGDFNDLEELVTKMIAFREGDDDIDTVRETLLYQANQLEKSMNARRYKKDKHTSDKFKDWE